MLNRGVIGLSATAVSAFSAAAQPTVLVIDPLQSSVTIEICISNPLAGTRCDTDSSPIAGDVEIELDDYGTPTQVTLNRFDYATTQALSYFFNFGVLGTVSGSAATVALGSPMGAAPVTAAVAGDGSFTLMGIPSEAAGTINISSTGLIGTVIGNQTIDLATLAVDPFDVSGTVSVSGGVVTLSFSAPLVGSSTTTDGTTIAVDGQAVGVAVGPVPEAPCPADANGDGLLLPNDFSAWIAAFNAQGPACDQNGDGLCLPNDFSAWIANFNAGC
jgi:hypothetical protein